MFVIPMLSEPFYMIAVRAGNYARAIQTIATVQSDFVIEPLLTPDVTRIVSILRRCESAKFDFVDAAIMTLARRLIIV